MEIINPCYSVLSNLEVMEALKNVKDTKKKSGLRNLATIAYETLQYLEDSPCKIQTRESVTEFLNEIKPFNLTSNELLMMVNDPPFSTIHIHLIVEDTDYRLSEARITDVLDIVQKHLLPPDAPTTQ